MSYQVLARKWRPRTFSEMAGQEHVLRALINALDHDRLHHAFLFTGTRGVGKTTIARILAKSLNCEEGVGSTPCGVCAACREIDEGRFVDLIEVDAASRTKVEDTRELLENVQYAPTRGRYKVYLIDEVHMLSKHSFNALLKTLEEPPPHIKFLLATTDPQRLPVTILSRCLQFNLKRLPQPLIREHLAHILTQEGIDSEAPALARIAKAADGSMRDALSLLDQAIAYGDGALREQEVAAMLGTIDTGFVFDLLDALAQQDGAALLACSQRATEQGCGFAELLDELVSVLHRIAVVQVVPDAGGEGADDDQARIAALAQTFSREDVQLFYQIALMGCRDLPLAPDARSGFEMILLRMLAFRPLPPPGDDTPRLRQAAKPRPSTAHPAQSAAAPARQAAPAATAAAPAAPLSADEWGPIVDGLGLSGMMREFASHCVLESHEDDRMRLVLDEAHAYLLNKQREQQLEKALRDYLSTAIKLEVVSGAARRDTPARQKSKAKEAREQRAVEAIEQDAGIRILQETFNAQIVPDTIRPADECVGEE
ncbi:MAG TPA: DNA polymerase III subunit gamma/tau [Gammaproteobacteria bacterium]|nr:DNA polymerase III subunit gamma/tau [Gammaproteobacteria bacterium]